MAHFAKLETVDGVANTVTRVVVVANADTADANGVEKEYIGAAWLERTLGGVWKQTSYNNNIRKRYAGVRYTYNSALDAFVPPKPFASWVLNEDTADWDPPVAPTEEQIDFMWDEEQGAWVAPPATGNPPGPPPQPYPSWAEFSEEENRWLPPVAHPDDGKLYYWNEEETTWVLIEGQ